MTHELTIGDVARRAGLRTSTIRYYESIDVLPSPRRVGKQRRYDPAIFERLAFIQTTQALGFSLNDIHVLFHHQKQNGEASFSDLWHTLARQKLDAVEQLIQHAHTVKAQLEQGLGCGCPDLAACMECVREQCAGT